jgi:uncharacterized protein (UPF0548 family)
VHKPFPRKRLVHRFRHSDRDALTYKEVGATTRAELPAGYRHVRRSAVVGQGFADFERAVDELITWQLHQRSGLAVRGPARVHLGAVVWMGFAVGPLRLGFRCKVVAIVDDLRRKGFAYGTLPRHPESGEEAFVVVWRDDDVVELQIVAFSRHATWWSKASGPLGALTQRWMTTRYLKALRQEAPR